jgi:DNA-binding NarL/FixJ family response regulator
MTIKVSIADDHPVVIDGLQRIFATQAHIHLLGCYPNGAALLDGLKEQQPDVLLLDIQMPGIPGDMLMPELKKFGDMRIIVLTNFDSALYASNMLKRGAHGYVLKTATHDKLLSAIEKVHAGAIYIDDEMQEKIRKMNLQQKRAEFSISTLTPREKEILQLIVEGSSAPEIAEKLFLSLGTVKNYRSNIMLKLDADNTASLVRKALRYGLAE